MIIYTLNDYLKIYKKIEKNTYKLREDEEKEADIVYKIKGKEIFFLIEHQTKVDKKMAYRILEYSMEIIRGRLKNIKGQIEKAGIPTVIPIVIYTGEKVWNTKQEVTEMQVEFETIKKVETITGYNLIDIRDKEKAIKDGENRGVIKGKLIIAKKMLEEKLDIDFIAKVTGLSRSEIEKL